MHTVMQVISVVPAAHVAGVSVKVVWSCRVANDVKQVRPLKKVDYPLGNAPPDSGALSLYIS